MTSEKHIHHSVGDIENEYSDNESTLAKENDKKRGSFGRSLDFFYLPRTIYNKIQDTVPVPDIVLPFMEFYPADEYNSVEGFVMSYPCHVRVVYNHKFETLVSRKPLLKHVAYTQRMKFLKKLREDCANGPLINNYHATINDVYEYCLTPIANKEKAFGNNKVIGPRGLINGYTNRVIGPIPIANIVYRLESTVDNNRIYYVEVEADGSRMEFIIVPDYSEVGHQDFKNISFEHGVFPASVGRRYTAEKNSSHRTTSNTSTATNCSASSNNTCTSDA
eukprot:Awhi_evm1s688